MSEHTSHPRWLRLVAENLHNQQRDYSIANTCEEAADAFDSLTHERDAIAKERDGYKEALEKIARGNRMLLRDQQSLSKHELLAAADVVADVAEGVLTPKGSK